MKIELSTNPSRSATRTLKAFSMTLVNLMLNKSFEQITVNEICDQSGYPRATFYNYFDDKYDLLNYFWQKLADEIRVDEYEQIPPEQLLEIFYNRIYNMCEKYENGIKHILKNNTPDSYFFSSLKLYIKSQIKTVLNHVPLRQENPVPKELMVEHYCNTVFMIFEWRFGKETDYDKAQTWQLVSYLLMNL